MANNCFFQMKIAGEQQAVQEFVDMLQGKGPPGHSCMGRVYSFDLSEEPPINDPQNSQRIAVEGQGDCAWSVLTAMIEENYTGLTLESETKRLNLAVEVYSSEPGFKFQEHFLICNGNILINECIDYEEHFVEGMDGDKLQEFLKQTGLTKDELLKKVNVNGDYCIGGFREDFGQFKDLFPFLDKTPDMFRTTSSLNEVFQPLQSNGDYLATPEPELQSFYYTFGTSDHFPYKRGWVEVQAPDRCQADQRFRSEFPDVNPGFLNCSSVYTGDQFKKLNFDNHPDWRICHKILTAEAERKPSIVEQIQFASSKASGQSHSESNSKDHLERG